MQEDTEPLLGGTSAGSGSGSGGTPRSSTGARQRTAAAAAAAAATATSSGSGSGTACTSSAGTSSGAGHLAAATSSAPTGAAPPPAPAPYGHAGAAGSARGDSGSGAGADSNNNNNNNNNNNSSSSSRHGSGSVLSKLLLLLGLLLKIVTRPLRRLVRLAFPPGPYDGLASAAASDRAARDFAASFRAGYLTAAASAAASASASSEGPSAQQQQQQQQQPPPPPPNPFSTAGYRATLSDVASTSTGAPPGAGPLLLVYLHSPHHPDCAAFCRRTLADARMIRFLNDMEARASGTHGGRGGPGLRCFGTTVHSADGQHLAQSLGAAAYPFLALVRVQSSSGSGGGGSGSGGSGTGANGGANGSGGSIGGGPTYSLEVHLRMQGRKLRDLPPDTLLASLRTVLDRHGAAAAEGEARRSRREEEARLRREQDREYQEALAADRAREAARRAERDREERDQREREEGERRAREERETVLARARGLVGDEPPAGTPDTARVRLTLPNGRRIDRRFRADDALEVVRAFLTVHFHENDVGIVNFSLSTSFPKRTYEDPTMTLREGDLVPQAVLMVQDLDS